jgi:hypothetical protein
MGRTESLNLKNDYERACGWCGHFNKSEMALFSECTDRYAQKLLDTADIVRDAILRQARYGCGCLHEGLKEFIGLFLTRMPGVAALQPARFALGLRAVFSDDSRPTFFLTQHSPNCSDREH